MGLGVAKVLLVARRVELLRRREALWLWAGRRGLRNRGLGGRRLLIIGEGAQAILQGRERRSRRHLRRNPLLHDIAR